jgi:hypothetical protein
MITCVAMDMFASEPPWVKGKDQYLPVSLRNPRERAHDADPEEHCNESADEGDEADERATVVDVQREGCGKECCAHHNGDQKDLERRADSRLGQRRWPVHDHQAGSGERECRTEQRDPAAVHHVDETAELSGDAHEDDRDVDQRSGTSGLGTAYPPDPDLAARLDQP